MAPGTENDLTFNVAGLLKEPVGATRAYELEGPELALDEHTNATDVRGQARLLRIRSGVLAEGEVSADVTLECSRCLEPAATRVEAAFEEEFRPPVDILTGAPVELLEGESEEDFSRISEKHGLDLTETVRQSLLVAVPYSPLCRPDCAGLCPECGADLNVEDCGHTRQAGDARLSGLAALLEKLD